MLMKIFSLCLVALSSIGYHLGSRSIPEGGNQFLGVALAYMVAFTICFIAFFITKKGSVRKEWKAVSHKYLLFGFFVPGLEAGFILMYHNGWQVSQGALVAEISTCALLVIIGITVFKDRLSKVNWLGIVLCLMGVIMASWQ